MKTYKRITLVFIVVFCAGLFTISQIAGAAPVPMQAASATDAPIADKVAPLIDNPAPQAQTTSGTFGAFELSRAEFSAFGEFPLDGFDYHALSFIGDINNDGYDDFAVGAFIYDGTQQFGSSTWGQGYGCGGYDPGALYIVLGKPSGFQRNVSIRDTADLILVAETGYWFGRTFTVADLNADGKTDLVVAGGTHTMTSTIPVTYSYAHGSAYVIWGRSTVDWTAWLSNTSNSINSTTTSSWSCYNPADHPYKVKQIDQAADASFLGTDAEDRLGFTQMGSADVNGDDHLDLLVSSIFADTGTGKVMYTSPYTLETGNGMVYVVLANSALSWTLNMPISTTANAILKGGTISGTRQISSTETKIDPALPEMLGGILAGVGDVTGDGKEDFVVSSWQHMFTVGLMWSLKNVYLISGASITNGRQSISSTALTTFKVTPAVTTTRENNPGWSIARLGDINNDGISDFAFSDPWAPVDGIGDVYVYYGRTITNPWPASIDLSDSISHQCGATTTTLAAPDILLQSLQRGTEFGYTIAGLGDVNGDGHSDFMATAGGPEDRWGADFPDMPGVGWWYSRGDAYLFFGNSGLLNPCDYVVQSERYAWPNVSWVTDYRSQYRHLWSEETGAIGTDPLMDRGGYLNWVSTLPGDFNGDGKGDILVGDASASSREECAGINMVTDPASAQCGLGKVYLLLGKSVLSDTAVPELWMRDTSLRDDPALEDIGNQPNLESDVFHESPDLWVRLQDDGLRAHQTPTTTGQTVYVNLRLTNSGSEWTDGSESVDVYYTIHNSFTWPSDFSAPYGGVISTVQAHPIGPGDRVVFTLPFTIPTTVTYPTCLSFLAVFDGETQTANAWDDVQDSRRIVARASNDTCSPLAIELKSFDVASDRTRLLLVLFSAILVGLAAVVLIVFARLANVTAQGCTLRRPRRSVTAAEDGGSIVILRCNTKSHV